jgi:hypothetical protein
VWRAHFCGPRLDSSGRLLRHVIRYTHELKRLQKLRKDHEWIVATNQLYKKTDDTFDLASFGKKLSDTPAGTNSAIAVTPIPSDKPPKMQVQISLME